MASCSSAFEDVDEEIDVSNAIQIVDLDPFLDPNAIDFHADEQLSSIYDASEVFPDDELYSNYLNGLISFDDLMREMHRSESKTHQEKRTSKRRGNVNAVVNDEVISTSSDESSDSDYVPPQRKAHGTDSAKKPRTRNKLSVELAQYLGEAERHLNNDAFDEAERICRDIVNAAPNCSAPYVVLAEAYYRRGDTEKSGEFLFEAAKRDPTDVNLWTSLVDFAEEKGDLALATHYTKLALRSAKHAVDLRRRLIQYCERAGRKREALLLKVSALTISPEPSGPEQFQLARSLADQLFKFGDRNSSIRAYESAFEVYPDEGTDTDKNIALSMMLQLQKYENALKFFLRFCGVSITTSTGKLLRWDRLSDQLKRTNRYTGCTYPPIMNPDLYLKLFLVMIHLKLSNACMDHIRASFTDAIAQTHSDWLLDIVKACHSTKLDPAVGELLSIMTNLEATKRLTVVWIMLAERQVEDGKIDSAIDSYTHVIRNLDPRHAEARVALGNLLNRVGRVEEALDVLKPSNLPQRSKKIGKSTFTSRGATKLHEPSASVQPQHESNELDLVDVNASKALDDSMEEIGASFAEDDVDDEVDEDDDEDESDSEQLRSRKHMPLPPHSTASASVLMSHDPIAYRIAFERCRMLDNPCTLDAFIDEAWNLLFTDVARFCGPQYFQLLFLLENKRHRAHIMHELGVHEKSINCVSEKIAVSQERNVSNLDIWTLYLRLIELLIARLPGSLRHLEVAATWGYVLPAVHTDEGRRAAACNLLISSSILSGHGTLARAILRDMYNEWSHRNQYWNLLNLSCLLSRDPKKFRSIERLLNKGSSTLALKIMSTNECISRGSYRFATARLIGIRETNPDDPLVLLLLGVCFLAIALQRFISSRHAPILQSFGFFGEYRRVRGHCQEVYFNIARACQQLSLGHAAIHYYEKVLGMEPVGTTELEKSYMDLRREAAFNLSLIYRSQGNLAMVHHLMQTYLVI